MLVIFGFLLYFTAPLFQGGKLGEVLSWQWRPFQGQFGILPMVVGSVCLAGSALVLAFPLGLGLSGFVYLQGRKPIGRLVLWVVQVHDQHSHRGLRVRVRFSAGSAAARKLLPGASGFSWLAAALILSLLILPTIVLGNAQQLSAGRCPTVRLVSSRLGSFSGSGTLLWVMTAPRPPGVFGRPRCLGFSRALGDTIIALMLAGNAPQVPHSLLDAIRTLTAHIALVVATDSQSTAYQSIFAAA